MRVMARVNCYITSPDLTNFKVVPLSGTPRLYLIKELLSFEECDQLIAMAREKLRESLVVDNDTGASVNADVRTSRGGFFTIGENDLIQKIELRMAQLINLPVVHGESLQILHYREGQYYAPHYDYFDPGLTGSKMHLSQGGQRFATLITYLNEVERGGETSFPEIQIKVSPQKGCAILFYNCTPSCVPDPLSKHGAEPVLKGEKWVITKWFREGHFGKPLSALDENDFPIAVPRSDRAPARPVSAQGTGSAQSGGKAYGTLEHWQEWIVASLKHGVTVDSIEKTMRDNGFASETIRREIAAAQEVV